jgi:hypothetical protein
MPLHVDRTSIQTNPSLLDHVLYRDAPTDAATSADASNPGDTRLQTIAQLASNTTPNDVSSVAEAETLTKSLISAGKLGFLVAHGSPDPSRVGALVAS